MNTVADRYEVGDLIGQGGMGSVYRALDTNSGETVAVKLLKSELIASEPDIVTRFAREGEALRQLNHPNIVKVLGMAHENGQHYLIMEYVAGGSLYDVLKSPQSVSQVLNIALELADALTRAHHLKIIHRDIKPANVLIAEDGTPRLTDFGVAQMGKEKRLTETGVAVGTLDYLSPEALNGEVIDARSDIWAFGVMLYEMLAGKRPFEGDNLTSTLAAILLEPIPDLESLRPDVPVALVDLIYRMLEKDRNQRIPSVRQVGAELEAIMQGRETPSPTSSPIREWEQPIGAFDTPTPAANIAKHNLPVQTTPFVGRQHELAELNNLIRARDVRLITILAPGGMGKTRLSLAAAEQALPRFADGVYVVELAPLSDAANILSAIASTTEYPFQSDGRTHKQQLLDFLSAKHLLLVMDNFEHVLAGAALMSDILSAAPHVNILATSRERLNLQEEMLFRLEGMDFPDWETPEAALEYSAVKLFMQSARRVQPNFELKAEDLRYVARICRMVEGMPLGIVLAAAWVDVLKLPEITVEIGRNVDFLESESRNMPDRHRSIRAVFDYSWNLLSETERDIFMKLSVFRGGFTREAAEAVVGANLRTLMNLMNKSLIRRDAASGRYDIHELTRQYAEARLQDAGMVDTLKRTHAEYIAGWMVERFLDIKGRRQVDALEDIETDFENVRAAWQWAYQHNERGMLNRMLDTLYLYQDMRGQYREGVENLLAAETALTDKDAIFHRIRIRRIRHTLMGSVQEYPFDDALVYESLDAARARQDVPETAFCLLMTAYMHRLRGFGTEAIPYFDQARQLYQEMGDLFFLSEVLSWLSFDNAEGLPLFERVLALKQQLNDVHGLAWASHHYAVLMLVAGNFDEAEKVLKRGIEQMRLLKNTPGIIFLSNQMITTSLLHGDIAEAEAVATRTMLLAMEKNNRVGMIQASANLGLVGWLIDEPANETRKALENLRTSDNVTNVTNYIFLSHLELCLVMEALHAGDYATVKTGFRRCVQGLRPQWERAFPMLFVFAIKAIVDADDKRHESAAEWLSVAFHYPYQGSEWLEEWRVIIRLRADLQAQLDETAYNSAWERGKARDMETVIQDLLAEYTDSTS